MVVVDKRYARLGSEVRVEAVVTVSVVQTPALDISPAGIARRLGAVGVVRASQCAIRVCCGGSDIDTGSGTRQPVNVRAGGVDVARGTVPRVSVEPAVAAPVVSRR